MRKITFAILLLIITGCRGEKRESTSMNNDKKVIQKENLVNSQTTEGIDSLRDPYSPYYLSDKSSKEIGQMILDDNVRPTDNKVTFSIMDSLLAKNYEDRKFYFKVFVKILDQADGALAEVVGIPAMKFVEYHTKEFIDLSSNFTYKQQESWANFIGWEIYFDSKKDPAKDGEKFVEKLVSNCSDLDSRSKLNLDNFSKMIIQTIEKQKDNK
jgi:hypothetical protein